MQESLAHDHDHCLIPHRGGTLIHRPCPAAIIRDPDTIGNRRVAIIGTDSSASTATTFGRSPDLWLLEE